MSTVLQRLPVLVAALSHVLHVFHGGAAQRVSTLAGPFRMILTRLEDCPPELAAKKVYGVLHYLSAVRDRKNPDFWWYSLNGTIYRAISDNLTVLTNVATWSSAGGWKDNAIYFNIPKVCTLGRTHWPNLFRMTMKHMFDDPDHDCPVPPGTYSATNVSSDLDVRFPPTFFYGKYRANVQVTDGKTKEVLACKRTFFSLVPKIAKQRP